MSRTDFDHQIGDCHLDSRRLVDSRPAAIHAGGGGAPTEAIYLCTHGPEDGCECRKPTPDNVQEGGAGFGISPGMRSWSLATATRTWGGGCDAHHRGARCRRLGRNRPVARFPRSRRGARLAHSVPHGSGPNGPSTECEERSAVSVRSARSRANPDRDWRRGRRR